MGRSGIPGASMGAIPVPRGLSDVSISGDGGCGGDRREG